VALFKVFIYDDFQQGLRIFHEVLMAQNGDGATGPIASVRKIARSTILTHRYRLLDPSSTFYENKSA
jgi:hypothetical protein